MDSQRNLLLIALLFVSFLLWQAWVQDTSPKPEPTAQQQQVTNTSGNSSDNQAIPDGVQGKTITVNTDVLSLTINTTGGDIEEAKLLSYADKLGSSQPFLLLESLPAFVYQAQSGLVGNDGPDRNTRPRPVYNVEKTEFSLPAGQDKLVVPLTYTDPETGVTYTKSFTLERGKYDIAVSYQVNNTSDKALNMHMYGQLKQTVQLPTHRDTGSNNFALHTYRGAAYSSSDNKYQKYDFDDIKEKKLDITTQGGWVSMLQQYFATAWVPPADQQNTFYTAFNSASNQATIGFRGTPVTIQPGTQQTLQAKVWVGPELQDEMASVAPHLDLTVDYGWLWFISQPLFKLLKFLHSFIGNWGFSIIMITFIVRGIMYPLTKAQYTSMAKMRMLQPKLQAMRERIGDDKQRMSQEMMAMYKQEKVNPLGGCFPLLIQMPIFLALYYMLMGSVELRHAPFALWIQDLSAQDPYYILPLLMGLTMFIIQKLSPAAVTDPMQQKIMNLMPVIFTVFFLWFPSGLVLYYIVSNLVTIIQQQLIYRGLEKKGLHSRDKK